MAGALLLARFLESFLFGVEPTDALTLASVPIVLAVVALAACAVPAYRAMRVSPVEALRSE
jgi:ABC-type antimicrobial peptide transport system permease subunit